MDIEALEGYFVQTVYDEKRGWVNLNIMPLDSLEEAREWRDSQLDEPDPKRIVYITTILQVIE